jgi:hypothetical protein
MILNSPYGACSGTKLPRPIRSPLPLTGCLSTWLLPPRHASPLGTPLPSARISPRHWHASPLGTPLSSARLSPRHASLLSPLLPSARLSPRPASPLGPPLLFAPLILSARLSPRPACVAQLATSRVKQKERICR